MTTVAQHIYNFFEGKSDVRVSKWYLMTDVWPTLGIVLIYLCLVYGIVPAYMKNRKPYKLLNIIRLYNIFQITSCTGLIYLILTSGWIQGDFDLTCQPIDYSNRPRALAMLKAFYWTYFLKMTEFLETVFFLLRKKISQVTKLHVYHHAYTFILSWIACKYVGGGMASFPIMLNCSIHILMYCYYYLASLGPTWQKKLRPWKPRLTIAQMVQFVILIFHFMMVVRPVCDTPRHLSFFYVPHVAIVFKMFYDFYQASYKPKKPVKSQE